MLDNRESRSDLWLAVVEDLEVFFRKVTDGITLAIADYNRHEYFIYVGLDHRVRRGRFWLLSRQ